MQNLTLLDLPAMLNFVHGRESKLVGKVGLTRLGTDFDRMPRLGEEGGVGVMWGRWKDGGRKEGKERRDMG